MRSVEVQQEQSPFGWSASVTPDGAVTLHDETGRERVTYSAERAGRGSTKLKSGAVSVLKLHTSGGSGEQQLQIANGQPKPRRRHHHDGQTQIAGRSYDFVHRPRWRTEVRRDGDLVALLRRRLGPRQVLVEDRTSDDLDRLVLALAWFAVYPGRPGAISMAFESI